GRAERVEEAPGLQDLTADVDFTTVARAAVQAGMEEMGFATQQEWLEALGIGDLGLPDEVRQVSGAAGLGTAFHAAGFRRGTTALLPGFRA
ncbi:MAG TPA: SAM-dependent methyltransferase, partial [Candidatus Thermoplasmatota archaeon]|nr:SAM-dependent methyltransferase [Candidatus Thermoplasmatota archaeon]